jgi:hypothetical protein
MIPLDSENLPWRTPQGRVQRSADNQFQIVRQLSTPMSRTIQPIEKARTHLEDFRRFGIVTDHYLPQLPGILIGEGSGRAAKTNHATGQRQLHLSRHLPNPKTRVVGSHFQPQYKPWLFTEGIDRRELRIQRDQVGIFLLPSKRRQLGQVMVDQSDVGEAMDCTSSPDQSPRHPQRFKVLRMPETG